MKLKKKEDKPAVVVKKEQEETLSVLSVGDLKDLEIMSRDLENAKLMLSIEEQSLRNSALEYKILEMRIEKQRKLLEERDQAYKNKKKEQTALIKSIAPKYGLQEGAQFGYNPSTGAIVVDVDALKTKT